MAPQNHCQSLPRSSLASTVSFLLTKTLNVEFNVMYIVFSCYTCKFFQTGQRTDMFGMPLLTRHAWFVVQKVRQEYSRGLKKDNQTHGISIREPQKGEDMHWMGLFVGWARASRLIDVPRLMLSRYMHIQAYFDVMCWIAVSLCMACAIIIPGNGVGSH